MRLSFLTLQRGNALGDALRHKSAPHRTPEIGRRASRAAFPRWGVVGITGAAPAPACTGRRSVPAR
ncbi:hypothetical protein CCL09_22820 [Pseudomonas congelans]|nr:hypothetical protein CCL09_22820 [Pseudomonas congelans]